MKPMTSQEAIDRFQCEQCRTEGADPCGWDCVVSATCSLLCRSCRRTNFFPGDMHNAPAEFPCVHCGAQVINRARLRR